MCRIMGTNFKKSPRITRISYLRYGADWLLCLLALIATGCYKPGNPRIFLSEGVEPPAVTALAWLDAEDSSVNGRFVSVYEDGSIAVWDVHAGLVSVMRNDEDDLGPETINTISKDATSPDGTTKVAFADDGSILLLDNSTEKELARYYYFGTEWVCINTEGFYNASFRGAAFLTVEDGERRFGLEQLSGALFRPDLFAAFVSGPSGDGTGNGRPVKGANPAPLSIESLFRKDNQPPLVSLSFDEDAREIKVKVTEQKGGAGFVALYRKKDDMVFPVGLFLAEEAAGKKYSEKGNACYEISLSGIGSSIEADELGVSAFNKSNTVESGRLWVELPPTPVSSLPASVGSSPSPPVLSPPVLRALLAAADEGREKANASAFAVGEIFSQQAEGSLYSSAEVVNLVGEEFDRESFTKTWQTLCAHTEKNDTLVLYLKGRGSADPLGNLTILPANSKDAITGDDLFLSTLGVPSLSILMLLDLTPETSEAQLKTALLRFAQRLGPKAMVAAFGATFIDSAFIDGILKALSFDSSMAGAISIESRYLNATEFVAYADKALGGQGVLAFLPMEDFRLIDAFINAGELKFQTMASGMLRIDQVDKNPVPLIFGDTMVRMLPPGSYIIDMVYRNGYRETRRVELGKNGSAWVTFNYTPPLMPGGFSGMGALSGRLPSNGINFAELNPANYQVINSEAMEGMGMPPYYVAFLSGEKFYREGDYDKAIAEYSRSVSLKADYADAYISRANARRRKGDFSRAIEDYTRALGLKRDYAEVYNYRGFLYAQRGDTSRAIADYTQAIRYKADYTDAYFNRACAYAETRNWDLSIADFTQVIKLEPSNWIAYNQRGKAWDGKGDRLKAAEDYAASEKLQGR